MHRLPLLRLLPLTLSLAVACGGVDDASDDGAVKDDGAEGGSDTTDGGADATDGGADATDGTDGGTDGTDGGADGTTDGGADGTDGTTDGGTDGAADGGTDGTDGTTDGGSDGGADGAEPPPADYSAAGGIGATTSSDTEPVGTCDMDFTRYTPDAPIGAPLVILAHGFARGPAQMDGWAAHWASWGFEVIVPSRCLSTFSDHVQNGEDLTALAERLTSGPVIYAGHSAGGLSALVAAAQDGDAVGLLGLDPVNDFLLSGSSWAEDVTAPGWAFLGEPGTCNSSGNGVDMFGAAGADLLRLSEADHCDFENESDFLCTGFCNYANTTFSDEELRAEIKGLTTAALLSLSGLPSDADAWLRPGGLYYDGLITDGAISVP